MAPCRMNNRVCLNSTPISEQNAVWSKALDILPNNLNLGIAKDVIERLRVAEDAGWVPYHMNLCSGTNVFVFASHT